MGTNSGVFFGMGAKWKSVAKYWYDWKRGFQPFWERLERCAKRKRSKSHAEKEEYRPDEGAHLPNPRPPPKASALAASPQQVPKRPRVKPKPAPKEMSRKASAEMADIEPLLSLLKPLMVNDPAGERRARRRLRYGGANVVRRVSSSLPECDQGHRSLLRHDDHVVEHVGRQASSSRPGVFGGSSRREHGATRQRRTQDKERLSGQTEEACTDSAARGSRADHPRKVDVSLNASGMPLPSFFPWPKQKGFVSEQGLLTTILSLHLGSPQGCTRTTTDRLTSLP